MSRFKTIVFYFLTAYFIVTLIYFYLFLVYRDRCITLLHKWEKGEVQDYYIECSLKYRIPARELSNLKIKRCESYFEAAYYHHDEQPDQVKRLGSCDMKLLFESPPYDWLEFLFGHGSFTTIPVLTRESIYEDGALLTVPFFDNNDKVGSHIISWDCENSINSCPAFKRFMQAITLKKEHDNDEDKEFQERIKRFKE